LNANLKAEFDWHVSFFFNIALIIVSSCSEKGTLILFTLEWDGVPMMELRFITMTIVKLESGERHYCAGELR